MMDEKDMTAEAPQEKRRRGRRGPMSEEQRQAIARTKAANKEKAANLKPEIYVQYQDSEAKLEDLIAAVKADFRAEKKRTQITAMKLYVKPEEHATYYVINETFSGKVSF